ncbi:Zn-dependent hydrolase, partial [Pseudoalteromonas sp. S3178]
MKHSMISVAIALATGLTLTGCSEPSTSSEKPSAQTEQAQANTEQSGYKLVNASQDRLDIYTPVTLKTDLSHLNDNQ